MIFMLSLCLEKQILFNKRTVSSLDLDNFYKSRKLINIYNHNGFKYFGLSRNLFLYNKLQKYYVYILYIVIKIFYITLCHNILCMEMKRNLLPNNRYFFKN